MNAAVSRRLVDPARLRPQGLPASLHDRYCPAQADALALIPQVIDTGGRHPRTRTAMEPRRASKPRSSSRLSGRQPSAAEADLLRATFISCVDHTPATPSSLAAVTSYSGGNPLKTALAAGISAMGESPRRRR